MNHHSGNKDPKSAFFEAQNQRTLVFLEIRFQDTDGHSFIYFSACILLLKKRNDDMIEILLSEKFLNGKYKIVVIKTKKLKILGR